MENAERRNVVGLAPSTYPGFVIIMDIVTQMVASSPVLNAEIQNWRSHITVDVNQPRNASLDISHDMENVWAWSAMVRASYSLPLFATTLDTLTPIVVISDMLNAEIQNSRSYIGEDARVSNHPKSAIQVAPKYSDLYVITADILMQIVASSNMLNVKIQNWSWRLYMGENVNQIRNASLDINSSPVIAWI
jgi:hypothetical protein